MFTASARIGDQTHATRVLPNWNTTRNFGILNPCVAHLIVRILQQDALRAAAHDGAAAPHALQQRFVAQVSAEEQPLPGDFFGVESHRFAAKLPQLRDALPVQPRVGEGRGNLQAGWAQVDFLPESARHVADDVLAAEGLAGKIDGGGAALAASHDRFGDCVTRLSVRRKLQCGSVEERS